MRWRVPLLLATALLLLAVCDASPSPALTPVPPLRTRTSAVGGHLRLSASDTMSLSGAGDGKSKVANESDSDDDEDRKTLSQQIADGKYGLLQNEIYTRPPERPGIISYDPNAEVPRDTAKNLGGLEPEEIWLAEDHVLVLRGGWYPDHKPNRTKPGEVWPPIDNYKAPPRQVKIPSNPKVPPPFPVQLTDDGPTEFIGTNGSSRPFFLPPGNGSYFAPPFPFPPPPPGNFTPQNGPFYPPPPYGYPPPGNFVPGGSPGSLSPPPFALPPPGNESLHGQPPVAIPPSGNFTPGSGFPPPFYPFPYPPPPRNGSLYPPPPPGFFPPPPRNGSFFPPPGFFPPPPPFGNGTLPPGFFPPPPGYFPPGAAFLPPPGSLNDTYDEDDPSIYYPPPYDFFYPRDNTTQVPPGPLVPGIILPPPPNFFAPLNASSSTTTTTAAPPTAIPTPPVQYLPRRKKPPRPSTSDDSVAFNQVTTEAPLHLYGKVLDGVVISTAPPPPVSYVVVPVTDITVSPPSRTKQRPVFVSTPAYDSVTTAPYRGRSGGISTTVAPPPLQYSEPATKTSYYFYEEPQVAQGHLSEAGVLKSQQGYYRDGYYYDPPAQVSPYNIPPKLPLPTYYRPSSPAPPLYYVPSKSTSAPSLYYVSPKTQSAINLYYNAPPKVSSTPAPPLYYYVTGRPQQYNNPGSSPAPQYYTTPRPQYSSVLPFKSNLQFYNNQDTSSRPVYQFSYQAGALGTSTVKPPPPPPQAVIQFASTPRTVYEYSFEKQRLSEAGGRGRFTTPVPAIRAQFAAGPTASPQYVGPTASPQYVSPTAGPQYLRPTANPLSVGPTVSPQYIRPTASPQYAGPSSTITQYAGPTSNPLHSYYTPQDERLLDDITKKYFTIFGQKLGGGGTTPMTPTQRPISLEGDTAVNYRPPLPAIEPESELVRPGGGEGELIRYQLPGNGAHFYFLTPQAVFSQPRQRYRRKKPPPR